jgi:iron complex transport system substrate-binding protein
MGNMINTSWKIALIVLISLAVSHSAWGVVPGNQNTENFTLDIFGNANMDDTINDRDIAYVEGVLKGTNAATNYSDADYDGKIDTQDIDQIRKIISGEGTRLVLLDSPGRVVKIKTPVERIIPLNRNAAEALRTIKASDKIVGVSDAALREKSYFSELIEAQNVGSASSPDFEKILGLSPNLVVYYGKWPSYETINATLKKANPDIDMIGLDCYDPETYAEDIMKLGYIVGKANDAKDFTNWYNEKMDKIRDIVRDIPEEEKPKVYEGGATVDDFYRTGGTGSISHKLIVMAGGKNIFENFNGSFQTDPENVMQRDPQFIICKINNIGGYLLKKNDTAKFEEAQKEITDKPGLANVSAVKSGNIYIQARDVFFGGRYFLSIIYMAKWFHPDLFKDLDPDAIHQEYLTKFQHLDYDLKKQGVFVYPGDNR